MTTFGREGKLDKLTPFRQGGRVISSSLLIKYSLINHSQSCIYHLNSRTIKNDDENYNFDADFSNNMNLNNVDKIILDLAESIKTREVSVEA